VDRGTYADRVSQRRRINNIQNLGENMIVWKIHKLQWLVAALSVGVAGYALFAYSLVPLGNLVHPQMKMAFEAHRVAIFVHIFCSMLAMALGPWQFFHGLRARRPALHRWSGRVYLVGGVLPGGISGLYVSGFAFGGTLNQIGFAVLAILWLTTGYLAYRAIRRGDVAAHQRWMLRNFALTFAAVTLRLYLGTFAAMGMAFETFYAWLGWLCWVPNLMFIEWFIRRKD
jgi:uncharacterized membrane protein